MTNNYIFGGFGVVEVKPIKTEELKTTGVKVKLQILRKDYEPFLSDLISTQNPVYILLNDVRIGTDYGAYLEVTSMAGSFLNATVKDNFINNTNFVQMDSLSKSLTNICGCEATNCITAVTKSYSYVHFGVPNFYQLNEMKTTVEQMGYITQNNTLIKNFFELLKTKDPSLTKINQLLD
jgi:hypothetical protein